ncbi:Mutator-like transposase domain-containing protein [Camponotus japonicus]
MSESKNKTSFFWRGKRVTQKVYEKRRLSQKLAKNLRNVYGTKRTRSTSDEKSGDSRVLKGHRIVHLQYIAEQLICKGCHSVLSLQDVVKEETRALASVLYITCRECKMVMNKIYTDKSHSTSTDRKHFDVNTKAVIGATNAGIGFTHLNKLLASLNIPPMKWDCYKRHEKEICPIIEKVAQECCEAAAMEERESTITNLEKIKKLL